IEWLAEVGNLREVARVQRSEFRGQSSESEEALLLSDVELLDWLTRWGHTGRLQLASVQGATQPLVFNGQLAELTPQLQNGDRELSFTHRLSVPGGES